MINQVFLWYEITKYTRNTFKKSSYIDKLIKELESLNLDHLKESRQNIKENCADNQNLQTLMIILCKSCKISKILIQRPLTFNSCQSALKAAVHLRCISEFTSQNLLSRLLDKIKEDMKFCVKLEDAISWYKLKNVIKEHNENSDWNNLKTQIDTRLKQIAQTEDKDKLIENLNFLLSFNPEIECGFEWLTKEVVDSTLIWIKSEKALLDQDLITNDDLESFEKIAEQLIGLIDSIDEVHVIAQDIRPKLNDIKASFFKRGIDERNQSNSFGVSQMDDFEKTELSIERIKKRGSICRLSECNEEGSFISAYKGFLDNSIPICIKLYHQKSNSPSNLFIKECKLFSYLSEKWQCFLKYKGWYKELSDFQNSQCYSAFAIVSEAFDSTLMNDIIKHSRQNQKYTYQEYQKIVVSLLDAFSILESVGIAHKNVKPHNILITGNRMLKIAEFSLSERFEINRPTLYSNNTYCLWKDNYRAPEIFELNEEGYSEIKSLDNLEKCDVYSLGLIFLQMYSLLPIAELNTPPFWSEIDYYVSTFKPKNVANLLRKMLAINSAERANFKECLDIFMNYEENKNEYSLPMQIFINKSQINANMDADKYLKNLEMISTHSIEFCLKPNYLKHLSNEVTVEFLKGLYKEKLVFIRTYRSQDFTNLLPYVKEAKVLKKLNGNHPTFIEYYGSIYSYKSCCEFSNVTEWCNESLMSEISKKSKDKTKYKEDELLHYALMIFQGLIALKKNFNCHRNIKPHNIVFSTQSCIKITGFFIPKAKIYSECIFPENFNNFIQNEEGYSSPENINKELSSTDDIEKSDIFSLGLVFLQMVKLESVADWNNELFKELKYITPEWLRKILQNMLAWSSGRRGNYDKSFNDMEGYIRAYAYIKAFKK
ncbi:unnamed protein product [Blepharisma stoltei]|uniref:Protein kinase domain-containing protein n=1 Tax=Blepharisma stoltei TaxID=1481888 RepID=A0AAU9J1K8_9CILI|nr:unnamed protein product [Blepharisma stoltei]